MSSRKYVERHQITETQNLWVGGQSPAERYIAGATHRRPRVDSLDQRLH